MNGIVRSITHWTGGAGMASTLDRKHYHSITQADGSIVPGKEEVDDNIVTSDGDYAAHTLRLNTGSAGFAMAGMAGAVESPFDPGPYPINERQFEAHCRMLAKFHSDRGILPISDRNCITHAEVEPNLGVKQRGKWDLTRLPFKPGLVGAKAVGDYMRQRVNAYLGAIPASPEMNRPILREGDRGAFVLDMQKLLRDHQFFSGALDGIYGPRTKASVLAFQDHAGLLVDGVVGPMTWKALMNPSPRPNRDVSEADLRERHSRTIKAADDGEKVAKIGAAAVSAGAVLDTLKEASDKATDTLPAIQQALMDNWLVVLIGVLGIAAYFYGGRVMSSIRRYRVDDARSGANMGR